LHGEGADSRSRRKKRFIASDAKKGRRAAWGGGARPGGKEKKRGTDTKFPDAGESQEKVAAISKKEFFSFSRSRKWGTAWCRAGKDIYRLFRERREKGLLVRIVVKNPEAPAESKRAGKSLFSGKTEGARNQQKEREREKTRASSAKSGGDGEAASAKGGAMAGEGKRGLCRKKHKMKGKGHLQIRCTQDRTSTHAERGKGKLKDLLLRGTPRATRKRREKHACGGGGGKGLAASR